MKMFIAFTMIFAAQIAFASPVSPEQKGPILEAINDSLRENDLKCEQRNLITNSVQPFQASSNDFTNFAKHEMQLNEDDTPPTIVIIARGVAKNQEAVITVVLSNDKNHVVSIRSVISEKSTRRVNRGTITHPDIREEVVSKDIFISDCK